MARRLKIKPAGSHPTGGSRVIVLILILSLAFSTLSLAVNSDQVIALILNLGNSTPSPAADSDQDGIDDARDAWPMIPQYHVSLGRGHSCALDDNGVTCWGDNQYGQVDVPATLEQPYQVSADGHDTCALDLFYVTCWGISGSGLFPVDNATMMSSNVFHVCVIDADGLRCFRGGNWYGELNVPGDLSNPIQVAAGYRHTCALDDRGVSCWGSNRFGESDVPKYLVNPRQVTAGHYHTCVLDDNGVQCWGRSGEGQLEVPLLANPRRIESGYDHVCALDDHGLRCWGRNLFGQSDVPSLVNVSQVGAGTHHTCAIEAAGVVCWGYNFFAQTQVPAVDLVFIQDDVAGLATADEPVVTASTELVAPVNHSSRIVEVNLLTS